MLDRTIKFKNLKEMIAGSSERYGERPAFYIGGQDVSSARTVTYKEFYKDIMDDMECKG